MKQKKLICLSVIVLGLSCPLVRCSQEPDSINSADAVVTRQDPSLDELDMLVDEAAAGDVFKGSTRMQEPTGMRLFLMKCGMPLVGLMTSTVLKYRAFKGWFKQHCVEPVGRTIGSRIHCCGCCHASETSDQK